MERYLWSSYREFLYEGELVDKQFVLSLFADDIEKAKMEFFRFVTYRNRNNMLQDSKDVYFFSNEQLDKNDYLLNVQNGTLDLSENEPVFLSHNPDMLLSKICNGFLNLYPRLYPPHKTACTSTI